MVRRRARALTLLASSLALAPLAGAKDRAPPDPAAQYHQMVRRVADMVGNERAYQLANAHGLSLLNVLWEDTGRWEGSAVGPNISDVTIEVEGWRKGKAHRTYLMPVMRYDNFTDKTADVRIDRILIPVGNQRDSNLHLVTLKELLESPGQYMSTHDKGKIRGGSLLAR